MWHACNVLIEINTSDDSSQQGLVSSSCSWALKCFRPLHTLLGLSSLVRDTNSVSYKKQTDSPLTCTRHSPVNKDVSTQINTVSTDQTTKRQRHEIRWHQIPRLHPDWSWQFPHVLCAFSSVTTFPCCPSHLCQCVGNNHRSDPFAHLLSHNDHAAAHLLSIF